jgi:hypothetical protein
MKTKADTPPAAAEHTMEDDLAMLSKIEAPKLLFEFPDESGREPIKMTYGLEMDIRRWLPDPGTATELLLADPVTQDYIIRRCLTIKNKMITDMADLVDEESVDLDMDTRENLLLWAGAHALYFFAKRTLGLAKLGVQLNALMPANRLPTPTSSGSSDSASSNPSVGASE